MVLPRGLAFLDPSPVSVPKVVDMYLGFPVSSVCLRQKSSSDFNSFYCIRWELTHNNHVTCTVRRWTSSPAFADLVWSWRGSISVVPYRRRSPRSYIAMGSANVSGPRSVANVRTVPRVVHFYSTNDGFTSQSKTSPETGSRNTQYTSHHCRTFS